MPALSKRSLGYSSNWILKRFLIWYLGISLMYFCKGSVSGKSGETSCTCVELQQDILYYLTGPHQVCSRVLGGSDKETPIPIDFQISSRMSISSSLSSTNS